MYNRDGFDAFSWAAMKGFFGLFRPFFALFRVVPELSASFLEPSMVKSSSPSRAPLHNYTVPQWPRLKITTTATTGCCRGFCSVPGPLQSVQRAELWGVILALQTTRAVHLGVDNLNVVRHVGRLSLLMMATFFC